MSKAKETRDIHGKHAKNQLTCMCLWDSAADFLFVAYLNSRDFISVAGMGAASSDVEKIRAALAGGLDGLASGSLEDND